MSYNIASPNPASSELFGSSMVFLDNKLLVGAPGHNMNAGIVYQYNYDTDWSYSSDTLVESLTTNYGKNLAVSNDRTVLTISASAEVFIYNSTDTGYVLLNNLTGTSTAYGDSVAISNYGDYIAIADRLYDGIANNQGSVTIYNKLAGYSADTVQTLNNLKPEETG